MVVTRSLIFLICALVCFLLAAFKVPASVDWTNLAFAFITAALIFGGVRF